MTLFLRLELIVFVLIFLFIVIFLIRSNKIIIRYSFVWFAVGFLMMLAVLFPKLIVLLAKVLGFQTITNMLFFLGIVLLLFICFSLTIILSNQSRKIRLLIQELSTLKGKTDEQK